MALNNFVQLMPASSGLRPPLTGTTDKGVKVQPMIKKAASRAFIICGGLLLLAMVASTVYVVINGGLEGKDIFAAPLLGFYTGIYYLVFAYPAAFIGLVIYAYFKNE